MVVVRAIAVHGRAAEYHGPSGGCRDLVALLGRGEYLRCKAVMVIPEMHAKGLDDDDIYELRHVIYILVDESLPIGAFRFFLS